MSNKYVENMRHKRPSPVKQMDLLAFLTRVFQHQVGTYVTWTRLCDYIGYLKERYGITVLISNGEMTTAFTSYIGLFRSEETVDSKTKRVKQGVVCNRTLLRKYAGEILKGFPELDMRMKKWFDERKTE